jgi:hypothetical protein
MRSRRDPIIQVALINFGKVKKLGQFCWWWWMEVEVRLDGCFVSMTRQQQTQGQG